MVARAGAGRGLDGKTPFHHFGRLTAPTFLSRLRAKSKPAAAVRQVSVRQSSKWHELGAFVGTGSAMMAMNQALRAKNRATLLAQKVPSQSVLEMEHEDQVPYWQQGDMNLYTEDNLAKRQSLRQDANVLEALQQWWSCAQRSMQSEKHEGTSLSRDNYVRICLKVYKAMIEDFVEAEAAECAAQDWVQDSKGESELSRELFMDAMFELGKRTSLRPIPSSLLSLANLQRADPSCICVPRFASLVRSGRLDAHDRPLRVCELSDGPAEQCELSRPAPNTTLAELARIAADLSVPS